MAESFTAEERAAMRERAREAKTEAASITVWKGDTIDFLVDPIGGEKATLKYYNLSAGWNVLPGEVFIGRNTAKASQFFVIGGVGSTDFVDQKRQTVNLGFGMKLYFSDRLSARVDLRDHIFSLDLLGRRENTQNLELTAGFTYNF